MNSNTKGLLGKGRRSTPIHCERAKNGGVHIHTRADGKKRERRKNYR